MANWIDPGYWPDAWLRERAGLLREIEPDAATGGKGSMAGEHGHSGRTSEWRAGWRRRIRAEMALRRMAMPGSRENAPDPETVAALDAAEADQFGLLERENAADRRGRIPRPHGSQMLWAQHKYSVMARDVGRYRQIGRAIARDAVGFAELAADLTGLLCAPPSPGNLRNALQHMWGHVARRDPPEPDVVKDWSLTRLLAETRWRAMAGGDEYVRHSTALGELGAWLPEKYVDPASAQEAGSGSCDDPESR